MAVQTPVDRRSEELGDARSPWGKQAGLLTGRRGVTPVSQFASCLVARAVCEDGEGAAALRLPPPMSDGGWGPKGPCEPAGAGIVNDPGTFAPGTPLTAWVA